MKNNRTMYQRGYEEGGQEMMKMVRDVIEKNDLGLYSGDVKSLVDILSSLDKLTE